MTQKVIKADFLMNCISKDSAEEILSLACEVGCHQLEEMDRRELSLPLRFFAKARAG